MPPSGAGKGQGAKVAMSMKTSKTNKIFDGSKKLSSQFFLRQRYSDRSNNHLKGSVSSIMNQDIENVTSIDFNPKRKAAGK